MPALRRHASGYNFIGVPETGLTVRWGSSVEIDPKRAPWPELADISISNRCSKGCAFCYRDSTPDGGLMTLDAYRYALESLTSPVWGPVFQVALGAGAMVPDPDRKWSAFRVVPTGKGKALEAKPVVPNFKVDSLREVRMVPDQATLGIAVEGLMEGKPKASLEPLTPDPTQFTLHYRVWSGPSNVPGMEMSLWVKDSTGTWERLRATGTAAPFEGIDTQIALDTAETAKVRKAVALGFGYAVLARLDLQRIEVPMTNVVWEKA